MTEAQWLASEDPAAMLDFLRGGNPLRAECPSPPPSGRKLRLFAVACCRAVWHLLADPRSRQAVEVAERFADGKADGGAVAHARDAAYRAWLSAGAATSPAAERAYPAWAALTTAPARDFRPEAALWDVLGRNGLPAAAQAALLRDAFGNPFRPPVLCCRSKVPDGRRRLEDCRGCVAALATLRTPTALRLARGVYAGRDFAALPVLADALEEAGCEDEGLLGHLRGMERCPEAGRPSRRCGVRPCPGWIPLRGPHVRGCWALDLVLGKE